MLVETELLLAFNVVVYATLGFGLVRLRRKGRETPGSVEAAFRQIEAALERRFPDLPEGYTMREGLSRARTLDLDVRWDSIEAALDEYEGHRYGDLPISHPPGPELRKLANDLRGPW